MAETDVLACDQIAVDHVSKLRNDSGILQSDIRQLIRVVRSIRPRRGTVTTGMFSLIAAKLRFRDDAGKGSTRRHAARGALGLFWLGLIFACGPARAQERNEREAAGRKLFDSYCAACHQYDDQGMGEAPPLAGSSWVEGPLGRLARIVLHGVRGRMEVAGKTYDREMPGFGANLSDSQAAALLTYVRARFAAVSGRVTAAEIRQIRRESGNRTAYWSVEELLQVR